MTWYAHLECLFRACESVAVEQLEGKVESAYV